MAIWDVDLTTRDGARAAVRNGATAAFVFCAMGVLGIVVFGVLGTAKAPDRLSFVIGAIVEAAVGLVAGLRMRRENGLWWAVATAALLILEMVGKVVAMSVGGLFISAAVLAGLVNGIRGLRALKDQVGFADEDIEVFN